MKQNQTLFSNTDSRLSRRVLFALFQQLWKLYHLLLLIKSWF